VLEDSFDSGVIVAGCWVGTLVDLIRVYASLGYREKGHYDVRCNTFVDKGPYFQLEVDEI
jgi:hypothetical protein